MEIVEMEKVKKYCRRVICRRWVETERVEWRVMEKGTSKIF
jgi:hypothetical protein